MLESFRLEDEYDYEDDIILPQKASYFFSPQN